MRSALYVGRVAHERFIPRQHRFSYPFYMWFLDLDRLDELPDLGRWFSTRRFALSRFTRSDYLGDAAEPLATSVRSLMLRHTGRPVEGAVFGLINVRTAGLYFSPVNFYFGYDSSNRRCTHMLAEVSNIPWNERHHYAHYLGDGDVSPSHPKAFHVSPFNPDRQHYRWHISPPDGKLNIRIGVDDNRGHIFDAGIDLTRQPLTRETVRRQILRRPVMTAWIVGGIYWQALRLFLKGVPYVPYRKETT